MTNLEIIDLLRKTKFKDFDGDNYVLDFSDPLSAEEQQAMAAAMPTGEIHPDLQEIIDVTRGWMSAEIEFFYFDLVNETYVYNTLDNYINLGNDGFGNLWLLELTPTGAPGNVFYFSHDPAEFTIVANSLNEYLQQLYEFYQNTESSIINTIHETYYDFEKENPNRYTLKAFLENNAAYEDFLQLHKGEEWQVIDLRAAKKESGFSWGKLSSIIKHPEDLIWVVKPKPKGFFAKLLEW